jgi:hypothetical protein
MDTQESRLTKARRPYGCVTKDGLFRRAAAASLRN